MAFQGYDKGMDVNPYDAPNVEDAPKRRSRDRLLAARVAGWLILLLMLLQLIVPLFIPAGGG